MWMVSGDMRVTVEFHDFETSGTAICRDFAVPGNAGHVATPAQSWIEITRRATVFRLITMDTLARPSDSGYNLALIRDGGPDMAAVWSGPATQSRKPYIDPRMIPAPALSTG